MSFAVPLSIISGFPKVKKLTENVDTIKRALKNSSVLELLEDGIRRKAALPQVDFNEKRSRTIIATVLPWDNPRIEDVIKYFEKIAPVNMAWLKMHSDEHPLLTKRQRAALKQYGGTSDLYALVEFKTIKGLEAAISGSSWRSVPQVRPLLSTKIPSTTNVLSTKQKKNDKLKKDEDGNPAEGAVRPKFAWAATKRTSSDKDGVAIASLPAPISCNEKSLALGERSISVDSNPSETHNRTPTMPIIGCKGFGLGRGKIVLPFPL